MQSIHRPISRKPWLRFLVGSAVLASVLLPISTAGQTPATPPPSFEDLAANAASARDEGRTEAAVRAYQDALALRPGWKEGWWYLGSLNYDSDRYANAVKAFQKLVALDDTIGPAWAMLGLSEFETKEFDPSFEHLQKAQKLGFAGLPIARVARYHLALLLNLHGEFEKALNLLLVEFAEGDVPEQVKAALGLAVLRVPLLPADVDPSKDALIHTAGEAVVKVARGKNDDAFQTFERLLKDYPQAPFLHFAYGFALARAGRMQEAESQLQEETRINPGSALPHAQLASIYLDMHRADDALASAQRAVELAPRSAAAHGILAKVLRAMGNEAQAGQEIAATDQFAAERPEVDSAPARAYRRGLAGAQMAPAAANEPAQQTDPGTFDELVRKAQLAQQNQQTREAISYYQRALQLRPRWEEGWRYLGTLCYMGGIYDTAVTAFQNSVALDESHPEVWALLGLYEFAVQQYDNALIHLQRGEKMGFGGNATAVRIAKYHLALLLNRKGEFARALDMLMAEVKQGSADDKTKTAMGISLLRMPKLPQELDASQAALISVAGETAAFLAQGRYDQAFAKFDEMIARYPDTPYLHYAYGVSLASISRYDEAKAQLQAETRISPNSALPHIQMASIALRLHKREDALQSAQRAVQLNPESAESYYVMGRSYLELGNSSEAIGALETASRLAPSSPAVHFSLARAYAKAKRMEEAERERAAFVRLNAQSQGGESMGISQMPARSADPVEFPVAPEP